MGSFESFINELATEMACKKNFFHLLITTIPLQIFNNSENCLRDMSIMCVKIKEMTQDSNNAIALL